MYNLWMAEFIFYRADFLRKNTPEGPARYKWARYVDDISSKQYQLGLRTDGSFTGNTISCRFPRCCQPSALF